MQMGAAAAWPIEAAAAIATGMGALELGSGFQTPTDGIALSAAARLTSTQFAIAAHASGKSGWLA